MPAAAWSAPYRTLHSTRPPAGHGEDGGGTCRLAEGAHSNSAVRSPRAGAGGHQPGGHRSTPGAVEEYWNRPVSETIRPAAPSPCPRQGPPQAADEVINQFRGSRRGGVHHRHVAEPGVGYVVVEHHQGAGPGGRPSQLPRRSRPPRRSTTMTSGAAGTAGRHRAPRSRNSYWAETANGDPKKPPPLPRAAAARVNPASERGVPIGRDVAGHASAGAGAMPQPPGVSPSAPTPSSRSSRSRRRISSMRRPARWPRRARSARAGT